MPKLAANLTMLFTDSPVLDRFARAQASGFHYVELLFPYDNPAAVAAELKKHHLQQVLLNMPAGDWARGDRGIAAYPDRVEEFRRGVKQAIEAARLLGCPQMNCLVGKREPAYPAEDQQRVMVENLRYAASALAEYGLNLTLEALNPYDVPGFLLSSSRAAFAVLDAVGAPNARFQYDVYHMQRVEGELAATLEKNLGRIGHIQIADNPGRHQPGTGEINYRFLLQHLDRIGYDGYVALEYVPQGTTEESLAWVREYGIAL